MCSELKKQFKLMIICHGVGNGGAQRVTTVLANEFSREGYTVTLAAMSKEPKTYPIDEEIDFRQIESHKNSRVMRVIDRTLTLRKIMYEFNPDCIISLSTFPNLQTIAAKGFKKYRLIVSERTDPSRHPTEKSAVILRNILYKIPDAIVFQTPDAKAWFKEEVRKKGIIIPNPLTSSLPLPYEGERRKVIVGVGSLVDQKNWMVLLKAFELFVSDYPDYKLIIYGDGDRRNILEEYILNSAKLKGTVELPGFESNVHQKINDCALYVSCADYDGISNSVIEALALGLPSVCTDCPVGGARMMINNGNNGILIPVEDFQALYLSMKKIVDNPELEKSLSNNAIKIRGNLEVNKIFKRWEKIVLNND